MNDTLIIDDDRIELIADFCRETEESLDALDTHITITRKFIYNLHFEMPVYIDFTRGLDIDAYLENIRGINRVVHTVKGITAFLELRKLNAYCHAVEDLTTSLAKGAVYMDQRAFDIIEKIPVVLNRFLETLKTKHHDDTVSVDKELEEINACTSELLRRLDGKTLHLEEIRGKDYGRVRDYKKELKVSIDLDTYDEQLRRFQAFTQDTLNILKAKGLDIDTWGRVNAGFVEHLDSLIISARGRIVPSRYPRLVTDLGHSLGKNIIFKIERNDAQARPDVWDRCHNALVHLVRNAVDHGIETPAQREKLGKTPHGHIWMDVYEDFRNIYLSLDDDGSGIDPDEVAKKAVEKRVISREQAVSLTEVEKQRLIFEPGFTTCSDAGDISGRGVGLDAVLKEIEGHLNGKVILNSKKGVGANFILEIPKSETLSECIRFGDKKHRYAIPVVPDVQYLEVNPKYLESILGKIPIYTEGNLELPLLNLFEFLHPEEYAGMSMDYLPIIKLGNGKTPIGIVVPAVLGHERIKIDRRKVHGKIVEDNGLVFGYGLTDPITVVLDLEYLQARLEI